MTQRVPLAWSLRSVGVRTGIHLTSHQIAQLEDYWRLLEQWNRTINLTALPLEGLPRESLVRLVEEPMAAARVFPERPLSWFDLGSGCGSPAIPIKVVRPAAHLTMVESRSRKAAFLREAIRKTELSDARVLCCRIEELDAHVSNSSVDVITVRAVRVRPGVAKAILHIASPMALIVLFGPVDWTALRFHFKAEMSDRNLTVLAHV